MDINKTDKPKIILLVDCSGSMSHYVPLINRKIKELTSHLKANCKDHEFGLATFDSQYNGLSWTKKSVHGHGSTALYNSCVELLRGLTAEYNNQDKFLIVVITDGDDTQGRFNGTNPTTVANEVSIAEDLLGWDFTFVGTNVDAYKVGASMGVKGNKTLGFANSDTGFELMLDSLKDLATRWLDGQVGHSDTFFSDEVRKEQEALGAIRF